MNIDEKMLIIEKGNTSTLTINNHLYNFKLEDDFIVEIEIYLNLERKVNDVKDKKPVFGVVSMDGLEENEKNNKRKEIDIGMLILYIIGGISIIVIIIFCIITFSKSISKASTIPEQEIQSQINRERFSIISNTTSFDLDTKLIMDNETKILYTYSKQAGLQPVLNINGTPYIYDNKNKIEKDDE